MKSPLVLTSCIFSGLTGKQGLETDYKIEMGIVTLAIFTVFL